MANPWNAATFWQAMIVPDLLSAWVVESVYSENRVLDKTTIKRLYTQQKGKSQTRKVELKAGIKAGEVGQIRMKHFPV